MLTCLKCKTPMKLFRGSSMASPLADGNASIVTGFSCPNCATWVEIPIVVDNQRFKSTHPQATVDYEGMTSRQYGAKMRSLVEDAFDNILIAKENRATYKDIVRDFALPMSSTTCERYVTLMRKERNIDGTFVRGVYRLDKPDSEDTKRRRGVAPEEKQLSKCKIDASAKTKSRRTRRDLASGAAHAQAVSL